MNVAHDRPAAHPAGMKPTVQEPDDVVARERVRVQSAYNRRDPIADSELYAPWSPSAILERTQRRRISANLLCAAGVFPRRGDRCLEVGMGSIGWLATLIDWGLRETDLHGIDVDPERTERARDALPCADLRVGDATTLPWGDSTFTLVVASTLFTSILDTGVRRLIAGEITRVLVPGGALLWYDFAFNNPSNPDVRKVTRKELIQLFPELKGTVRSCTLAPPLARLVASHNSLTWVLATALEAIPFLRTHVVAVLVKK